MCKPSVCFGRYPECLLTPECLQMDMSEQAKAETQLLRSRRQQQTGMGTALQRASTRKGAETRTPRRKEARRQRSLTMTSPHMMASLPAAEALGMALGCGQAMAERCALARISVDLSWICRQRCLAFASAYTMLGSCRLSVTAQCTYVSQARLLLRVSKRGMYCS